MLTVRDYTEVRPIYDADKPPLRITKDDQSFEATAYRLMDYFSQGGQTPDFRKIVAFMGIPDIHQMNAVKSVLAAAMNAITLVIFALSGAIVWKYALVMGLAGTIGGYAGARVARRMKPDYIRAFVVFVGFAVAFYSWFGKK